MVTADPIDEGLATDNSLNKDQELVIPNSESPSPYTMGQLTGKVPIVGKTTNKNFYLKEYVKGKLDYKLLDDNSNTYRLTLTLEEGYYGKTSTNNAYDLMVDSVRYVSLKTTYYIDISVENGQVTMTDPINVGGHQTYIVTSSTNPSGHKSRYDYRRIVTPSSMQTDELLDNYQMLIDGADRISDILKVTPEWNPYSESITPEVLDAIAGIQAAASHQGAKDPITRVLSPRLTRLYYAGIIGLLAGNAYRKHRNHSGRGYSIIEWGGTKQNIKVHRK